MGYDQGPVHLNLPWYLIVSCCVKFWETLRGSRDATDTLDVCPRRVHAGSSCLCRSGLSAEESGSRAISQMVLLAQTLFEVVFWMRPFKL